MSPYAIAFLGVGAVIKSKNDIDQAYAQAEMHKKNAEFYREQAKFAAFAGDRQIMIFDREQKVLHADQASAFAKAGVDTQEGSGYIAREMFYGDQEQHAIYEERDLNVRLANLRADQADRQASEAKKAGSMALFNNVLSAATMGISASNANGKVTDDDIVGMDSIEASKQYRKGNLRHDSDFNSSGGR